MNKRSIAAHPANLALRFMLEIGSLLALGFWGWHQGDSWLRFGLAIGAPLVAALLWGTFRVPNDPGPARVAVPGLLRLLLELTMFGAATWALFSAGASTAGWILGATSAFHYLISYDRIRWLLRQ